MKKVLIAVLGSLVLFATPCLANEISVSQDVATTKVTVTAELGENCKNKKLMLYCLIDGGSLSEIPSESEEIQKTDFLKEAII